jgi:hypothetical protein
MESLSEDKANISLNDIVSVISIIDIVSSRGAFKGPELSTVGALRDRFSKFVEQNKPPECPDEETKKNE